MKHLANLFIILMPAFVSAQSIELVPFICGTDTVGSISVGSYREMVSFRANIPLGETWELFSCPDGDCRFERELSASVTDTLVIEHESEFPGPPHPDLYDLNLQIRRAGIYEVSQSYNLSGHLAPPPYDGNCVPLQNTTTAIPDLGAHAPVITSDGSIVAEGHWTLNVYDLTGQRLLTQLVRSGRSDPLMLSTGVYLYRFSQAGQEFTKRVVHDGK